MEGLKETFENLPESEKFKFLMSVFNGSQRHLSDSCAETSPCGSPEKHNLLQNILCGQKRVYEDNSPEKNFDSRKKQRTLDSWLIKHDASTPKNKLDKSSCLTKAQGSGSSNMMSKNCSNSSKVSINNMENANCANSSHSIPNGNEFSGNTKHTSNKFEKNKDNAFKDVLIDTSSVETIDCATEKYNLRSKKKFSKLSSISDTTIKYHKAENNLTSAHDCSKDPNSRKNTIRGENDGPKSHREAAQSETTETSIRPYCSLSNNSQTIPNQNDSNNVQHMEEHESYHSFNNLNVCPASKTSYTLRAKKKRGSLQTCVGCFCSRGTVADKNLNYQLDVLSQSNEHDLKTAVSNLDQQLSNLEAFSRMRTECSQAGLNILDILGDKKIQNLLSDHKKLNNEAVIFIGSFKSNTGKILPVVHLLDSKKKLLESISELQKIQKESLC